jgi:hypothetical protein
MTTSPHQNASIMTPVLVAGCVILMLSFAIRASFGVFQIPVGSEFGWPRAEFSLAIAIQNLAWGIGQPMFGAMAERFGDRKAIVAGAFLYALGLVLSSYAITPGQHQLLNILIGFGIAGTGFGVVLAVVGRATSAENRSMSLGIATAADITEKLICDGLSPDTPVAVLERATRPDARAMRTILTDLGDMIAREGVVSPAIIIVGDVVLKSDAEDRLFHFAKQAEKIA